jgi:hypothetical protein
MPLPGVRRLSDLVSRLLRPDQAARNAGQAATEAKQTIRERQAVEREVTAATEDQ